MVKQTISKKMKVVIWKRDVGNSQITKCKICEIKISIPESIRKLITKVYSKPYSKSQSKETTTCNSAEFGHKISEFNNGTTNADNLILICPTCNRQMHITNSSDWYMPMDVKEYEPEYMQMDDKNIKMNQCIGFSTTSKKRCRSIAISNLKLCNLHKNQRIAF
jgi:hypothetical protein